MRVNEIITNKIIEAIKAGGVLPWRKSWKTFCFRNAISKKAYRGVNVLMLSMFGKGEWYITPKQVFNHGGRIIKGSKTIPIVFYTKTEDEKDSSGNVVKDGYWMLRYYNVLNLGDTENVKVNLPKETKLDFQPIDIAQKLLSNSQAKIEHKGDRACYSPNSHCITLPSPERFSSIEEYYGTAFHELVHWTAKELDPNVSFDTFGGEKYSKEELVAEIGACFLANYCGVDINKTLDNSTSYVSGWLSKLGSDAQLIISAAAQAQKRFDYLLQKAGLLNNNNDQDEVTPKENTEESAPKEELVAVA